MDESHKNVTLRLRKRTNTQKRICTIQFHLRKIQNPPKLGRVSSVSEQAQGWFLEADNVFLHPGGGHIGVFT